MKIKVTKDLCEIKENEIWNVGDYNVHTVQVELSPEFNGLVNKVRYFVEDNSYDMLITDNVAQVPYEATVMEGTIKIGVYGYDADTDILVQSTSPVNKYITSGTYTGDPDNTQPLTPTDKEQMETAIQKNTNDITDLKENKQDKLISGVNIKTINNESILSSGNLTLVAEETDPIFTNSPAYSITDNDITYWNNKANMSDIPDVSNFITKDVDNLTYYTKSTDMQTAINNAVGNERTARENADNSLQNQIDAITVSSDVVDVVSTYQDLVDYDTQHIKDNDIIKVMQDSTHDNAISYYRWVIVNHVGSWEYVGSEGPYYTKSETDTLLNAKQNTLVSGQNIKTINNESLLGEGNINIQSGGTSDYTDLTNKPKINNVELVGNKTLNDLGIQPAGNYALESDMTEAQNDIDHLSTVTNLFEKITGAGTSVTLNDTSNTIMKLNLDTTTSSQVTTTGKNLFNTSLRFADETQNGVTLKNNNDGSFTITGTATSKFQFAASLTLEEMLSIGTRLPAGTYTQQAGGRLQLYDSNNTFIMNTRQTFTTEQETYIKGMFIEITSGTTYNRTFYYQVEPGSSVTSFEPYTGGQPAPSPSYPQPVHTISGDNAITISNSDNTKSQEYPINLGDIEICKIGDYKDILFKNTMDSEYYDSSLELNKWYLKKNVGKVVLNGSETWRKVRDYVFTYKFDNCLYPTSPDVLMDCLCNNFTRVPNSATWNNYDSLISYYTQTGGHTTVFRYNQTKEISDFTAWLSTHNTEVYYVLETPTYTLLNDTLQTQLDNIQYALAYDTQTNISQTNNDLPFIINAETYAKIGGGGTSDYTNLTNKPKINNVELNGNKTSSDLGLQPAGNYAEVINNTTTGSIAHIEDGANNYSINSLITDINHIQNLHGYNSPWAGGEGKNLLDPSKVSTITAYGLTITFSNNVFSISGTPTTQSASLSFNIIDYSDYSLSGKNYVIQALEISGTPIKSIYGFRTEREKRVAIVFDSVANPTINTTFKLSVSTTSQTVWSPYENICPITGWTGATISQSGEDTSNPTTRNISWQSEAGIIYGGTLDVISGVLTVTDQNIASYNGENLPSTWISDRDVYSVGETPTIGAQVVYKLATPATYQLPPQEIKTVLGINNIWSNTGNATVNYKADTKLYIDNKFQSLEDRLSLLEG